MYILMSVYEDWSEYIIQVFSENLMVSDDKDKLEEYRKENYKDVNWPDWSVTYIIRKVPIL